MIRSLARLRSNHSIVAVAWIALVLMALATVGCGKSELPVEYGKRQASATGQSVSGTAALSKMFELNGSTIHGSVKLSDRLEKAQVLVWAPNSFQGPSVAERTFLERWLYNSGNGGRTLIYIGRDFDPAERYWELISANSTSNESFERKRRWADVKSTNEEKRAAIPARQSYDWFDMLGGMGERKIDSLDGPWAEGIDPAKADLWLNTRLDLPSGKVAPIIPTPVIFPPWAKKRPSKIPLAPNVQLGTGNTEILLQSENDILAFRQTWDAAPKSQLIVVANGSFSLNMPLANPEHRKLAMRMVRSCPKDSTVVFLESSEHGLPVKDQSDGERGNAWRLMMSWPLGLIVLHFSALGLAFLIARFLQFGRARSLPQTKLADFGKHVEALGQLMARTKDYAYATNNLQQYRLKARRASGVRHDQPHALEVAPGAIHEIAAKPVPVQTKIEMKLPPRPSMSEPIIAGTNVLAESPVAAGGASEANRSEAAPSTAPPPDHSAH